MLVYLFEKNLLTGTIGETDMSTCNMSKPFNTTRIIGEKVFLKFFLNLNENSSLRFKAKGNAPKGKERYWP